MGSLDIELPEPQERKASTKVKLRNFLLASLAWSLSLALTLIYWRPVLTLHLTFRPEDYKTSLLVIVATFLASLVLETRLRAEIAPALIALRRDLALGVLSHANAAQQASYVVSGLTAEAFVRREFLKHEDLLRKMEGGIRKFKEDLLTIEGRLIEDQNYGPEKLSAHLSSFAPVFD